MADTPAYRVAYSGRVQDEPRALLRRATDAGVGAEVLAAVADMDRRLRVYPQFGQPLRDLVAPARLWVGVVPPLVVQYVLDESRRQVSVLLPITPLPHSGF